MSTDIIVPEYCNGDGDVRPDGDDVWYGRRTGFLGALAPSESIKDRSLSAVLLGD